MRSITKRITLKNIFYTVAISGAFCSLMILGLQFASDQDAGILDPANWEWFEALFTALLSLGGYLFGRRSSDKPIMTPFESSAELEERNWLAARTQLLQTVRSDWIEGHLRQVIHHIENKDVYLSPRMAYNREVLLHFQRRALQGLPKFEPIPPEKDICSIFQEWSHQLLILGEAASGKTISLIQLAKHLISIAESDQSQPIPIIVNLSTWHANTPSLSEWLAGELVHYGVGKEATHRWLFKGHFILLLDGFDEISPIARESFIEALNGHNASFTSGLQQFALCSRFEEYTNLQERIVVQHAVSIEPLDSDQIDDYLQQFGDKSKAIRIALEKDEELQKLARSPLILHLLPIVYGGIEPGSIPVFSTAKAHREKLFERYVERMFEHRPLHKVSYTIDQAQERLSNLARGMRSNNSSLFFIEQLQPSWLPKTQVKNYKIVLAVFWFVSWSILGLAGWQRTGWIGFLIGGLALGLIMGLRAYIKTPQFNPNEKTEHKWRPSWPKFRDGLISALVGAPFIGLLVGLFFGRQVGIITALIVGLLGIVGALIQGLFEEKTILIESTIPNQNIRRAIKTLFISMVLCVVLAVLVTIAKLSLSLTNPMRGILDSFGFLILVFIFIFMIHHLVIKHYLLRFFLDRNHVLPYPLRDKDLVKFLDDMTDRVLLRRKGAGWEFFHNYILEHFADRSSHYEPIGLDIFDFEASYNQGFAYFNEGNYEKALIFLTRAIELKSSHPWALAIRGATYSQLQQFENALVDLDRAIDRLPTYIRAIAERGHVHAQLGHDDAALADFNRAIELDPKSSWLFTNRAMLHATNGELKLAVTDFNHAIDLDAKNAFAITMRGRAYGLQDVLEQALADFNWTIELDPNNVLALTFRGDIYYRQGNFESAFADFNRVIELEPNNANAIAKRGQTYGQSRNYTDSIIALDRAIQLDPQSNWITVSRGRIYQMIGNYEAALADFNTVLERDPNNSWTLSNRGEIHRLQGNYEIALTDFNRAIAINPDDAWTFASRGATHGLLGNYNDALADFNDALKLTPNNAYIMANRGKTYRLQGKHEAALTDFDQAIEIEEINEAYYGRYLTHYLLNNSKQSQLDIQKALALVSQIHAKDPNDWHNTLNLALYHLCAGNPADAEQLYNITAQGGTPSPMIREAIINLDEYLDIFPHDSDAQRIRNLLEQYISSNL